MKGAHQAMKSPLRLGILLGALLVAVALPVARPDARAASPQPTEAVSAATQQEPAGAALAELADTILRTAQESHYSHRAFVDASRGVYDVDCSSFVSYLLRQVTPRAYALVPKQSGAANPRAFKFQQFFAALGHGEQAPGWSAVPRLLDAQPGDIIAWSNLPLIPGQDTGHVMVVAAPPLPNTDGTVSVTVYDATGTAHADHTRAPGVTGVGRGTLRFQMDAAGAPVAYQFAPGREFHRHKISIGRVG